MSVEIDSLMPEVEDVPEKELPDVEVTTDAPADKEPQARADDGKFKGKEEPEAKAEPKAEPKVEQKQEPRTIPLAAHLEERKALKAELDNMRRELEALKNPPKAPPPTPEFTEDPKGYVDHSLKSTEERVQDALKQLGEVKQTAQMSAQQAEELRFSQHLQAAEAAFVKETPDYYDALSHVRQVRVNQLKLMAPDITDEQIARQIGQEELGLAMQLARAGRNPIQTVYELARAYGYQRKEQQQQAAALPDVKGQKQLPPDQTLGSGAGGGGDDTEASNVDPFAEAFAEMFSKRKAS